MSLFVCVCIYYIACDAVLSSRSIVASFKLLRCNVSGARCHKDDRVQLEIRPGVNLSSRSDEPIVLSMNGNRIRVLLTSKKIRLVKEILSFFAVFFVISESTFDVVCLKLE